MGPWNDPGFLALAAGDVPGLVGEPEVPEADLVAAGGLLGLLEERPDPSPVSFLGAAPPLRTLALVVRCLQESRRPDLRSNPDRALLFSRAARRAADYLDGRHLGEARVARVLLAVRREVANGHRLQGHHGRARAELVRVRELMEAQGRGGHPGEGAEQVAYEAALLASEGRLEEAVDRLDEAARELPDPLGPHRRRLRVQAGVLAGWLDTSRAVELLRGAVSPFDPLEAPALHLAAELALAWWRSLTAEAVAVLDDLPHLRPRVLASGDPWPHAVLLWMEARLLVRLELHREAEGAYQRLWPLLFELDHRPELVLATGELLAVLARLGKRQEAAQTVATLENLLAVWKADRAVHREWQGLLGLLDRPVELEGAARRLVSRLKVRRPYPAP